MIDKIIKKKYCRIELITFSSISIGSGNNISTDQDIIRNSLGKPYIPASAIAGVMREALKNEIDYKEYFGEIIINTSASDETEAIESPLVFYDGVLSGDSVYKTSIRDNVSLDDYKYAISGAKFDREIVEPGVTFVTCVEQSFYDDKQKDYIRLIEECFNQGGICFGSKTTRGYGAVKVGSIYEVEFDLRDVEDVKRWIAFNLDEFVLKRDSKIGTRIELESGRRHLRVLELELELVSGILIRKPTTKISEDGGNLPDIEQMTVFMDEEEKPVIPGTTWSGAFRHRMKEYGINTNSDASIFGYVSNGSTESNIKNQKSKLCFSESYISGSKAKVISRNAIDRFSGGTKDGALFTEKLYYGGGTSLKLTWYGNKMNEKDMKALAATLTDLHFGFLAIGGETSIGRGLFRINKVGDDRIKELPDEEVYGKIFDAVKEVFGNE